MPKPLPIEPFRFDNKINQIIKMRLRIVILIVACFFTSIASFSQVDQKDSGNLNTVVHQSKDTSEVYFDPQSDNEPIRFLSRKEFWLGLITLSVLLILLPLIIHLIRKKNIEDELAVKLILTTIVIVSTLFLVVAGYDDKTIAPAFGLFGAILGYIFGKSSAKT